MVLVTALEILISIVLVIVPPLLIWAVCGFEVICDVLLVLLCALPEQALVVCEGVLREAGWGEGSWGARWMPCAHGVGADVQTGLDLHLEYFAVEHREENETVPVADRRTK